MSQIDYSLYYRRFHDDSETHALETPPAGVRAVLRPSSGSSDRRVSLRGRNAKRLPTYANCREDYTDATFAIWSFVGPGRTHWLSIARIATFPSRLGRMRSRLIGDRLLILSGCTYQTQTCWTSGVSEAISWHRSKNVTTCMALSRTPQLRKWLRPAESKLLGANSIPT